MKNYLNAFVCIALALLCFSCQPKNDTLAKEEPQELMPITLYYLDGQVITEETFIANHTGNRNFTELTQDLETGQPIAITNSFTSDQKYVDWGKENGHDLAKGLQIEKHLRAYAEENGIIEEYEKTQQVPQSYLDYMDSYMKNVHGSPEEAQDRTINILFDLCQPQPHIQMATVLPFMPGGWNDRVSRVFCTGMFSLLTVYDRSFFRNQITTVYISNQQSPVCWNFPHPLSIWLNNRMSSGIST